MVVCVSTASSHEGPRLFFFSGSKDFPDYPAYLASQRQMGGCVEDPCLQTHDLTEGTGQDISLVTIILTASLKPLGLNQAACSWAVQVCAGRGAGLSTVCLRCFSQPFDCKVWCRETGWTPLGNHPSTIGCKYRHPKMMAVAMS